MEEDKHNENEELDPNVAPPPVPEEDAAEDAPPMSKEEEYLAGWKRAQADYANLKAEIEKQRGEFVKYAASGTIEKLLPVLENLSTALVHVPDCGENTQAKAWIDGIGFVRTQFAKALEDSGVTVIDQVNVPFDPSIHEALLCEPADGVASDVVTQVIQAGYKMHDRVLMPAKVKVSE